MKKALFQVVLLIPLLQSCIAIVDHWLSPPRSKFTIKYNKECTGLDSLININGYYECNEADSLDLIIHDRVMKLESDSVKHMFPLIYNIMFYKDGLICSTNTDPIKVFGDNLYPQAIGWGTYKISGDTIKCQFVCQDYEFVKIRVDEFFFKIQSQNKLVVLKGANIGSTYSFCILENRIDSTNWLLKKKWFWDKDAWENRHK